MLLICTSGGYLVVAKFQQWQVRKEMKKRIEKGVPEDQLTLLKFHRYQTGAASTETFTWTKHGREFRHYGEMYDIVRQEELGDTMYFYCIHDFKESKIYARIDKLTGLEVQTNPYQRQRSQVFSRFLTFVYLAEYGEFNSTINSVDLHYRVYSFSISTWIKAPESPPPQVV